MMGAMAAGRRPRPRRPPKTRRIDVTRYEHEVLKAAVDDHTTALRLARRDLELQFQRIAQIQAEIDAMKKRWNRSNGS